MNPEAARSTQARARACVAGILAIGVIMTVAGSTAAARDRTATLHNATRPTASLLSVARRTISDNVGEPIPFGTARDLGPSAKMALREHVVAMASTPDGGGYWLASSRGVVYRYGDAKSHGLAFGGHSRSLIVAMVATADGGGYWLAASDGAVYGCGDAHFHGSALGRHPRVYVVAMAATPDGGGYWLAASNGEVYRFGDAGSYGSAFGKPPHSQIVAMAASPDGKGYLLVASDGFVYRFGDAKSHGSAFGKHPRVYVVAMASTPHGAGYWLFASDGAVYRFGNARWYGSAASKTPLKNPIAGAAAVPTGRGYWLLPRAPSGLPAPGAGFVAGHVTAIGDSVMLDAKPDLIADIPGIDVEAMVSRFWDQGIQLAQQLKAADKLGAIVIIDLGTNGPVTPQMFSAMMRVLSGASRVVFVTIHLPPSYSWWQSVNQTLEAGVPKYPQDQLADFNKLADANPQWFGPDGVHMPIGGAGAQAMARLIASKI
jgi:hypothetical protein